MKNSLEYENKIKVLVEEIEDLKVTMKKDCARNQEIMMRQSKMAAMGEMLGNIAHQWRQPLMELSSILISIEAKVKLEDEVSKEFLLDAIERSNVVMKYMSQTIDDFKSFFSKEKEKVQFKITDQLKKAVSIISTVLENKNIKLNIVVKNNPLVYGFKNEYAQVLINIIANAKDVLIARDIQNALIDVKVYQKENYCITEIIDNGGGIQVEPMEKVFDPFFTQGKKDGTGIGLFMAKILIEDHMNGRLNVSNTADGAKFVIEVPIE